MNIDMINYGYYFYNNEISYNRQDILDKMVHNKDYDGDFEFHFNNHVFDNIDWTTEPETDIETMYKERAQQLRDKYRYLIVLFSGGSDSIQILNTFMKNNIFIDEIQCFHHEKGMEIVSLNQIQENQDLTHLLEYKYVAKDFLEKVKQKSPNTIITSVDLTDFLVDNVVGKKYDYLGQNKNNIIMTPMAFNYLPRSYSYQIIKINEERNKQKDSVAIVRGIEKPRLNVYGEDLMFHFTDATLMTGRNMINGDMAKVGTIENFFWTADYPLIPVKQSHMILKTFREKNHLKSKFVKYKKKIQEDYKENQYNWYSRGILLSERITSSIIYPGWSPNIFFGLKPEKQSPEFILLDKMGYNHHGQTVVDEYRNFILKKYYKISNKNLLKNFMITKQYFVGKVNNEK
jgi:hypothetical protein